MKKIEPVTRWKIRYSGGDLSFSDYPSRLKAASYFNAALGHAKIVRVETRVIPPKRKKVKPMSKDRRASLFQQVKHG